MRIKIVRTNEGKLYVKVRTGLFQWRLLTRDADVSHAPTLYARTTSDHLEAAQFTSPVDAADFAIQTKASLRRAEDEHHTAQVRRSRRTLPGQTDETEFKI